MNKINQYLEAGQLTDSDHPAVIAYAHKHTVGITNPKEQAIALYYTIRDGFRYNPYQILLMPDAMKASYLLTKKEGYCIEKSNLMAACARVLGIPSRLGFGNVTNHLGTSRLEQELETNLLVFHGYAELYLNNRWVKVTPVFNKELCERYNVEPLPFDGETDAIFQESDKTGKPFMEYSHHYGTYADVPFDKFKSELIRHYPHLFNGETPISSIFLTDLS
jgi:transglutaminase-like putative cysteine protease